MIWRRLSNLWNGKAHQNHAVPPRLHVHETLKQLFLNLQIQWETNLVGKEKQETDYHVRFQNGDFHILAKEGRSSVRIHFLYFLEVPFGELDNLRFACNEVNQQYGDYKIIYNIDESENVIHLHAIASFRLSASDPNQDIEFGTVLSNFFELARNYRQVFETIRENGVHNLEESTAMNHRETFLAREMEWMHQAPQFKWRDNETARHSIQQLFLTFFEVANIHFSRLTIVGDELQYITKPREIANFNLSDVLIRKEEDGAMFVRESATLIVEVSFTDKDYKDYIIHLHAEEESEGILYFSVTFVRPHTTLSRSHSQYNQSLNSEKAISFLVAYDPMKDTQRRLEFEYQWQELQDSWQKHEAKTDDQLFMGFVKWPNVGFCLYWGRRFFNNRRYYEALAYFENAYRVLSMHYQEIGKEAKDKFYELNYYIGFCYAELGCYQRAYFFLDAAFTRNNIRYATEYVNCLTNSMDFRALATIQRLIKNVENAMDNVAEDDTEVAQMKNFLAFLNRRKGYVLIDQNKLDDAEMLFRKMLDDPESESYALDELTYIQQLRDKQQG